MYGDVIVLCWDLVLVAAAQIRRSRTNERAKKVDSRSASQKANQRRGAFMRMADLRSFAELWNPAVVLLLR